MCYKFFYKSDLPLLFVGESGTGKTFSAKIAHDCSCRKNKPFVAVNCGAIPESIATVQNDIKGKVIIIIKLIKNKIIALKHLQPI